MRRNEPPPAPTSRPAPRRWWFATPLLLTLACTAIEPARVSPASLETGERVTHADLDEVLRRFVDESGRVDYLGLLRDPGRLERYYLFLTRESPESAPARYPTSADQLAYWINAYNASVLLAVIRNYPIASVTDVEAPFPLHYVDDKIGFFFLQRVTLGGETTNLHALENSTIRARYPEPRVHFALNCASVGCPRLPRSAFTGPGLDEQLDRETRRFFAEPRNLRFDHDAGIVYTSAILGWYESDFTEWLARTHPGSPATLLDYISLYAPPEQEGALARARDEGYAMEFLAYDWSLNGRGLAPD